MCIRDSFYEFNFSFPTSVPGFIRESTIFPKKNNEEEFSHMILLHDIHVILMCRRRLMSYLDTLKWMLPTDVGRRMASVKWRTLETTVHQVTSSQSICTTSLDGEEPTLVI